MPEITWNRMTWIGTAVCPDRIRQRCATDGDVEIGGDDDICEQQVNKRIGTLPLRSKSWTVAKQLAKSHLGKGGSFVRCTHSGRPS